MKPEFGCSGPHSRLTARRATEIEMTRTTTRNKPTARAAPKGRACAGTTLRKCRSLRLNLAYFRASTQDYLNPGFFGNTSPKAHDFAVALPHTRVFPTSR
jgi:hypothetical protein